VVNDLFDFTPAPADPLAEAFEVFLAKAEDHERAEAQLSLAKIRARYGDDFLGFCELVEIIPKEAGKGPVPFELNEIQRRYCADRSPRDVILKARQIGFTTVEQARDVWFFLTRPSAAVRVVCQSSSDHSPRNGLSKRFDVMFAALRRRGVALPFEVEATGRWKLAEADGAASLEVIEAGASAAAAEKKGRSDAIHRLHVTEVAFFEHAAKTFNAMLECVPAPEQGSEVVFESTPNGAGPDDALEAEDVAGGPYFYAKCQSAKNGRSGYRFHFFSWLDKLEYRTPLAPGEVLVPETDREKQVVALGASPEQLKWYRAKVADKGQDKTDQEYPSDPATCFLVSGRQYFDKDRTTALIAAAQRIVVVEVSEINRPGARGRLRVFYRPETDAARPERSADYVVIVDTSEGTGGDRGVAQVWRRGTGLHVATLWGQFKPPELATEAAALGYRYNKALVVVERNNHGHACLQELLREDPPALGDARKRKYPRVFVDHDDKPGWLTNEMSRASALIRLEQDLREGRWATVDLDVLGEIRTFVVNKHGRAEAASGTHDDHVMTAAIGWDVLRRVPKAPPRGMGTKPLGLF
jgi:hypothetical protein